MLYSIKSRNPSLLSNSGPPRRAAALPKRPNCIARISFTRSLIPETIAGGEFGSEAQSRPAGWRPPRMAATIIHREVVEERGNGTRLQCHRFRRLHPGAAHA